MMTMVPTVPRGTEKRNLKVLGLLLSLLVSLVGIATPVSALVPVSVLRGSFAAHSKLKDSRNHQRQPRSTQAADRSARIDDGDPRGDVTASAATLHRDQGRHGQTGRPTLTVPSAFLRRLKTATLPAHLAASEESTASRSIIDRSALALIDHVGLSVPNHDHILPFYFRLLRCGMDPRWAANLEPGAAEKRIWATAGASQFHLPRGNIAQCVTGTIGLRYDSLDGLKTRLQEPWVEESAVRDWKLVPTRHGQAIEIVDKYGNRFLCFASSPSQPSQLDDDQGQPETLAIMLKQPIIRPEETQTWGHVATQYGVEESECRGLDFVEFLCPPGTAQSIALFYESVFDAVTSCVPIPESPTKGSIAVVGFGTVTENGKPEQSVLFREVEDESQMPKYDGHHIAIYVGRSQAEFEQAFKNVKLIDMVWVNPRFSDDAMDLEGARKWKQFRFKDIVDMQTGETIMELEHETRSVDHEAWPGPRCPGRA